MKSIRKDYKYKVCPTEYTTQIPVQGVVNVIESNGYRLNAAMDNRFNHTTGYKYSYHHSHEIPRLTERLFNMKIFYGMNSYWVSSYNTFKIM